MKVVEQSYEILRCPAGEECLAFIERVARTAYKSEDKIDGGVEACPACRGESTMEPPHYLVCPECGGVGEIRVREPSSHAFLRRILKKGRRAELRGRIEKEFGHLLGVEVVDQVLNSVQEDPPHESVIEHEAATVRFVTDRGLSHEIVRHRLCSFTQVSTRFVRYDGSKTSREVEFVKPSGLSVEAENCWYGACERSEESYLAMLATGSKPEQARAVLPTCLATEIVVTANLREWGHVLRLRTSRRAHADMRRLMTPLLDELRRRIPILFDEV